MFHFLARALAALAFAASALALPARLPAQTAPDFTYDATTPFATSRAETQDAGPAATLTELSFAGSRSGARIVATLVCPKRGGAHAAILWVHWLGDPATTNRTEFLSDAVALARNGATSLLIDAIWAAPHWFDVRTTATDYDASIRQVSDLRRSIDFLLAQPGVAKNRLAYVGHDFGAMYGALLAGLDTRPAYHVFMAATTKLSDWYLLGKAPTDKAAFIAQMVPLEPANYLPKTAAKAVLFQFSNKDEYVTKAHALEFAGYVPASIKTTLKFYDGGHDLTVAAARNDRRNWLVANMGL